MATKKIKLWTLPLMVAFLEERFPGFGPSLHVQLTNAAYWSANAFAHNNPSDPSDPTMYVSELFEATPLLSFEERMSLLLAGLREKVLRGAAWKAEAAHGS